MKIGIQQRIFLTTTLVSLLGLFALVILSVRQLNNATMEFYQHDLQSEAFTISTSAASLLEEGSEHGSNANLQTWLLEHRSQDNYHVMLLDSQGYVLADTNPQSIPNQRIQTEEVTAALQGRVEHFVRHDTAYTAVAIMIEGQAVGVLRVSAPMQPAYDEARQRWIQFALEALPILLITFAATLWLGRTIVQPVRQLNTSALQIASGAFDERIQIHSQDEIGQLGQSFNYMAEQIGKLIATQRSFVSNAAHELRNPLMSLKLRIQALLHEDLTEPEKTTYLQEIDSEINRLSHLVTELLTLARLDEGRHQVKPEPFDLGAFLHDLLHQKRIQALRANLRVEVQLPDNLPEVAIPVQDLRMILDNLLGNAIKYTPAGGHILLSVQIQAHVVVFRVEDTGEGFALEDQERLFERFFRADRSHNRQVPGTGLGLSIVRSLVHQYQGTITAHSPGLGQGAIFTVCLPIAA